MDIKPNILVVEDDEFLREIYLETLTTEGYAVDTAADGDEAIKKIPTGGYKLVLLDIIIPKIDGLSLVRKLKTENTFPADVKLVFLTNLDKDEEIKQALQLGDGYLIKSQLTPGDLIKEVDLYLSKPPSHPTPPANA